MTPGRASSRKIWSRFLHRFLPLKLKGPVLGLAICRQLMEQQNGTIEIKSRLGEGTRVVINLPVSKDAVPDMSEEERA